MKTTIRFWITKILTWLFVTGLTVASTFGGIFSTYTPATGVGTNDLLLLDQWSSGTNYSTKTATSGVLFSNINTPAQFLNATNSAAFTGPASFNSTNTNSVNVFGTANFERPTSGLSNFVFAARFHGSTRFTNDVWTNAALKVVPNICANFDGIAFFNNTNEAADFEGNSWFEAPSVSLEHFSQINYYGNLGTPFSSISTWFPIYSVGSIANSTVYGAFGWNGAMQQLEWNNGTTNQLIPLRTYQANGSASNINIVQSQIVPTNLWSGAGTFSTANNVNYVWLTSLADFNKINIGDQIIYAGNGQITIGSKTNNAGVLTLGAYATFPTGPVSGTVTNLAFQVSPAGLYAKDDTPNFSTAIMGDGAFQLMGVHGGAGSSGVNFWNIQDGVALSLNTYEDGDTYGAYIGVGSSLPFGTSSVKFHAGVAYNTLETLPDVTYSGAVSVRALTNRMAGSIPVLSLLSAKAGIATSTTATYTMQTTGFTNNGTKNVRIDALTWTSGNCYRSNTISHNALPLSPSTGAYPLLQPGECVFQPGGTIVPVPGQISDF